MFDYPYENVLVGVEPEVLRIICRPRRDGPPWQETLLRHSYENGVAFSARAQAVADRVNRTVGECAADVVIRCIYDLPNPSGQNLVDIDNRGNVLSSLWWLLHSPRVPIKASHNALNTLCRAYGWKRRSMTLAAARALPTPDIPSLPCALQPAH
jgi:hypothetical protein